MKPFLQVETSFMVEVRVGQSFVPLPCLPEAFDVFIRKLRDLCGPRAVTRWYWLSLEA